MTREEREQALEWFKNRPITMSGAKKMYDLAFEALSADGDTISRQAAIDAVNSMTYPSSLVDVKRKLMDLPAAQPERKTGRWEETWISGLDGVRRWSWRCSECGDEPYYFHDIHSLHYCPSCGAKMEGGEHETD